MDIKKNIRLLKIVLICSVFMFLLGVSTILYDGISGNGFRPLYIGLLSCSFLIIAQIITIRKLKKEQINNK